jgi:hypothetical protein
MELRRYLVVPCITLFACGDDTGVTASDGQTSGAASVSGSSSSGGAGPGSETATAGEPTTGGSATASASGTSTGEAPPSTTGSSGPASTGASTDAMVLDLGGEDTSTGDSTTGPIDVCKVQDEMDGMGECEIEAPPDSFTPEVQWSFAGEGGAVHAVATPLVANMNDDNGDGAIDLCDTPDVVVPIYGAGPGQSDGHIYVLDGESGAVVLKMPELIDGYANPAIGDIDGDGLPEVVTIRSELGNIINGHVVALEHDGTLKWESAAVFDAWQVAVALADLDNDGDVEIMAGKLVLDHLGATLFSGGGNGAIDIPFAADLDGDEDLEVLQGGRAYHHDGSLYYNANIDVGHPQVANLDDDDDPEVLIAGFTGITLLEHDGTPVFVNQNPSGDSSWWRPAAIHDVDGDDGPEILISSNQHYNIYKPNLAAVWVADVQDGSGFAAGTAFDFLGAGYAEAMYADEQFLFVYGESGEVLLSSARSSWTQAENPVVADVDNDGSAEIVVVSNGGQQPAVQVIRDTGDRWIQARRIWNQHAYHVTNVREDATIPQIQPKSWLLLNTFRTNAQIEGGAVCDPRPQ